MSARGERRSRNTEEELSLPQVGDSAIARYRRIAVVIRAKIMSGAYQPGSRIGTETELAESFGVSRITIRQAFQALENEGLIVRLRARGTFVAENIRPQAFIELNGYLDDLFHQAYAAQTVLRDYRRETATAEVAEALRIGFGTPVWRLRRLRVEEKKPKAWLINYIPDDIGTRYDADTLELNSFLQLLDAEQDTHLSWGHQKITAGAADREIAAKLTIEEGDPVLLVERVIYNSADRPMELLKQFYRADRFRFRVQLHRSGRG